jgi:hypothetical protein
MLYISFAWTTDAFKVGVKHRTRRSWNDDYAQRFIRAYQNNDTIGAALDKNFRFGGKQIGSFKLTELPFKQPTSLMTELDYKLEGLYWMEKQGIKIQGLTPRDFFEDWKLQNETVWVITFQNLGHM